MWKYRESVAYVQAKLTYSVVVEELLGLRQICADPQIPPDRTCTSVALATVATSSECGADQATLSRHGHISSGNVLPFGEKQLSNTGPARPGGLARVA